MAQGNTAQAKEDIYDGKHFIINEKKIDKFNTIRNRIVLTPAVCEICGLDLIDNIGGEVPYNDMTREEKDRVVQAVEKHKELMHTPHSQLIVTEDQIPTSYLGESKKKRR